MESNGSPTKTLIEAHTYICFFLTTSFALPPQVTDPNSGQQRSFTFNVVFEPEATQEEVFEHSGIKRLIDMALEG